MQLTKRAALALALAAALPLAACGGDDDDPPRQPEETRAQDSRTFTVNEAALAFAALPDAPETDRWTGTLKGSGYRIEVPKQWNGKLVMYAHGYAGTGAALGVTTPSIRRHLIEAGYAWAASSYSKNYYDVRAGVEDTNALALAFVQIAAQNRRPLAPPSRIYIVGHSMGGHIAAAAVDQETLDTANNKVRYHGAVPMCGVLGDTELFDYFAAYQLAAQQYAGRPATAWPVNNWAEIAPAVRDALFTTFPSATTAQGDKVKAIVQNLTGGARPMFDQGFAGPVQNTVWGTFGGDGTINGILNRNGVSTANIVYQLDGDPALSAEETTLNETILRARADPEANRLRRDGLRWIPKTNARINVPVVTLHTLGDMYVPFSMQQIYKRRADAQGTAQWLVQRAIRGVSHCDFTVAEQKAAFEAMVQWEQGGPRPEGDNVLDAATVARPDYGCRFTDNTVSADDSPAIAQGRPQIAAALPCPAS
ncbi:Alpha/beta hydrolase [Cupriavidus sp. H18C1]|uniref:alpha/beta hydrolase family protein n=1 Tax=Cupriavidus sp. H18C1 TaxID=3241601 RepID=UPI003BB9779E